MYCHCSFKQSLFPSSVTFIRLFLTRDFKLLPVSLESSGNSQKKRKNVANPPEPNLSVRASSVNYTDFILQVCPTAAQRTHTLASKRSHITYLEIHRFWLHFHPKMSKNLDIKSVTYRSKLVGSTHFLAQHFISHLLFSTGVCQAGAWVVWNLFWPALTSQFCTPLNSRSPVESDVSAQAYRVRKKELHRVNTHTHTHT